MFLPVSCTAGKAFTLFWKEERDLVNMYVCVCVWALVCVYVCVRTFFICFSPANFSVGYISSTSKLNLFFFGGGGREIFFCSGGWKGRRGGD